MVKRKKASKAKAPKEPVSPSSIPLTDDELFEAIESAAPVVSGHVAVVEAPEEKVPEEKVPEVYVVAKRRSITSRTGVMTEGTEVEVGSFIDGMVAVERLLAAGALVREER
jgi:hypothetical protein